jgi:hemolysin activation/secretion protein
VIERVVNASATKGQSLDQNKLDRGLAVLQKMVGFNITPSYQAGSVAGSTDLLVKIEDKPLISSSFYADNSGGRSTGRDKQTASIVLASPFGFGDALNLTALHSNGTEYASVAYNIPVGPRGLQLGVNSSYLEYTVVANEFKTNKPTGRAVVYGVDATYPLLVSKRGSLNLEANFDNKSYVNRARSGLGENYVDTSNYKVNVFSLVLSGSYSDNFLAGALNNASLNFANGHVDMDGSYDHLRSESRKIEDKAAENTQGYYKRTRLNISRNQFITDSLVLSLEGSGQWANRNLDASEKLYLGGINGIRAYPTSEGAGSEGYMFKLELRKYLPYNFNVSLFMDEGKVKQYQNKERNDNGDSLVPEDVSNEYRLKGYGATIGWNGPYNSSIKATYATRMGENPNPAGEEKRNDQDGSLRRHVLWLSGGIAF